MKKKSMILIAAAAVLIALIAYVGMRLSNRLAVGTATVTAKVS